MKLVRHLARIVAVYVSALTMSITYANFTCNFGGLYSNGVNTGVSSVTITTREAVNKCNVRETRTTYNCTGLGNGASPGMSSITRYTFTCMWV
jgi:hypothetical protein